jgi:hypothetical protein
MNLYQITSPNIGTASLLVKAHTHSEASKVARDVIEENRMTNDAKYDVHVTELVQPEDDGVGYCYPLNNVKTFKF